MPNLHVLREKRSQIIELGRKRGASNFRIFGSLARGESCPDSDVDFLVDLEEGRSLFDLGGLLMDLQELLGCEVDVSPADALRPRVQDRVLKEAIPL